MLDLASAEVFCSEVAARKVIAICATGTNESMDAQKPYRYSTFIDYWANVIGTAELIGKGLKGKPAQWAGDPAMKTQTRKFGSVFQTGQTGIDEDLWKSSLAKYKAPKFAAELGYDAGTGDPLGNSAIAQEQAPVMIGKLKDAGVTSVVLFTDISMTSALLTAANTQEYHPEWVETGFLFQDIGAIGRLFNKEQWAHAFGLGTLNVPVKGRAAGDPVLAWYWGRDNFSYNAGVLGEVVVLTFGIHLAGPKLTPDAFRNAVFGVGAQNGALADDPSQLMLARGKAPGIPYTEYLFGGDHPLIWWNNDAKPTPASATGHAADRRVDVPRQRQALPAGQAAEGRTEVLRHLGVGRRAARRGQAAEGVSLRRLPEQRRHPATRRRLTRHSECPGGSRCAATRLQSWGRAVGRIGDGSWVSPISHASTPAAHERPSAIAHTMRLWPRPMSPHANTPSSVVMNVRVARHVAARVELDAELLEHALLLRAEEAHREEHELARQLEVGALDLLELAVDHLDLVGAQRAHVAVVVAEEALGVDAVDALAALLVRRRHPEDVRPRGPRVGGRARVGRAGQDLELVDRRRALAVRGAEAVGAGVAAADDHDVLALGGDRRLVEVALLHAVAERAGTPSPGRCRRARGRGSAGRATRSRRRRARSRRTRRAARRRSRRRRRCTLTRNSVPSASHLLEPAIEVALLHLELGDAVAQQAADAVGALEHHDVVAGAGELLRGREPGGPGADHGDALARSAPSGSRGVDPALVPRAVDDLDLDLLDGDRIRR